MCGEEKEQAEKSPLYDYKRAYFKIVQALIDDHRTAFIISSAKIPEFRGNLEILYEENLEKRV